VAQYKKWARCAAALFVCGISGSNVLASSAAAEESVDLSKIQEVVVTARKHEEVLQRVPLSVSAITGDALAKRSLASLAAIGQTTPNFTFSQQSQGGRSAGVVYIRGVGQSDTRPTYDPAVGVYIDGVFLGRMQASDLEMLDVERVEILRGPQGTLFGKNTSGGAVSVISRQPDLAAEKISGRAQLTGGSHHRFDAVGGINIPLQADRAALLLSGSHREQNGYAHRADGMDMNDLNRDSGRVTLRLAPTDLLTVSLSADGMTYDETNSAMKLVFVNTEAAPTAALNAFTSETYDNRWLSPNDFFSFGTGPNTSRGDVWGTSATADLVLGGINLKSISAYRKMNIHNELDPDNSPVTVLDFVDSIDQHQFSQELQATGASFESRLNWVLGAYYFRENARSVTDSILLTPLFGFGRSFTQGNNVINDSVAGYGQGTYNLTEPLRVTAGLRFTHDKKQLERVNAAYPDGGLLEPTVTRSATSDDVSPRIGLDYQWTPAVMTYISAAKGYKAGGFNGRAGTIADFNQFEPEEVWTYEAGLRSDLLDQRVRFNATGFYSDYSDLQLQINGSSVVEGAPVPFNIVTNIPSSRIVGGELELIVVPASGLTLTSGVGLTYAKYTELPTDDKFVASNLIDRDSRFVNSPKVSFTASAEYVTALTRTLDITGRLDYAHKSSIYYDPSNTTLLRQEPYGLLNARLTFSHEASGVSVALFGTNLTDERYFIGGYNDATLPSPGLGIAFTNTGLPREYGVSVQVRF